jgi:hypothetical protein
MGLTEQLIKCFDIYIDTGATDIDALVNHGALRRV